MVPSLRRTLCSRTDFMQEKFRSVQKRDGLPSSFWGILFLHSIFGGVVLGGVLFPSFFGALLFSWVGLILGWCCLLPSCVGPFFQWCEITICQLNEIKQYLMYVKQSEAMWRCVLPSSLGWYCFSSSSLLGGSAFPSLWCEAVFPSRRALTAPPLFSVGATLPIWIFWLMVLSISTFGTNPWLTSSTTISVSIRISFM